MLGAHGYYETHWLRGENVGRPRHSQTGDGVLNSFSYSLHSHFDIERSFECI
jgi:hypothetical protein